LRRILRGEPLLRKSRKLLWIYAELSYPRQKRRALDTHARGSPVDAPNPAIALPQNAHDLVTSSMIGSGGGAWYRAVIQGADGLSYNSSDVFCTPLGSLISRFVYAQLRNSPAVPRATCRARGLPRAQSNSPVPGCFPANPKWPAPSLPPLESLQCSFAFVSTVFVRSNAPAKECLPCAPATVECGSETRSGDSTNRCEIRALQSSSPGRGGLPQRLWRKAPGIKGRRDFRFIQPVPGMVLDATELCWL
jgi:hypothetical protein